MGTNTEIAIDTVRLEFDKFIEKMGKPSEYNRMYGHHLRSFREGAALYKDSHDNLVRTLKQVNAEIDLHLKNSRTIDNKIGWLETAKETIEKTLSTLK